MGRFRRQSTNVFTVANGTNTLRTDPSVRLEWTGEIRLSAVNINLAANSGPVLVAIELGKRGSAGPVIAQGWIRGSTVSGAVGSLPWTEDVCVPKDSSIFAFIRNDSGATVSAVMILTYEDIEETP